MSYVVYSVHSAICSAPLTAVTATSMFEAPSSSSSAHLAFEALVLVAYCLLLWQIGLKSVGKLQSVSKLIYSWVQVLCGD